MIPTFRNAKTFGYLQAFHANYLLVPQNGIYHTNIMDSDKIEQAKTWFPFKRSNDLLISSYPKCGHHFTQKICLEIINANHNGKYCPELYQTGDMGSNTTPLIEFYVSQSDRKDIQLRLKLTDNMYPRIFWTHSSFDHIPINQAMIYGDNNKQNKIIVMIRNPKDCIISTWKFLNYIYKTMPDHIHRSRAQGARESVVDVKLEDMISYFVRGIIHPQCYFEWYESYWNAMVNDKYNILWLYYEDIVDNPLPNIRKIAQYIFDGSDAINEPEKTLNISDNEYNAIVDRIKITNVRKQVSNDPQSFELDADQFFRKGVNNDWINYLTEQQSQLIDETMYFKWAHKGNKIKYYQEIMDKYNHWYNKGYFPV